MQGDAADKRELLEKMELERAKERVGQRHRNKTKFTENLKRFAGDKSTQ